MPDCHHPRLGVLRPRGVSLAALGWILAAAAAIAGAFRVGPTLGGVGMAAQGNRSGATARSGTPVEVQRRAERATRIMEDAERWLRRERERTGILPEGEAAGDRSGLLGGEVTPLMTTLGSLEAKRISTNPAWAGAITSRLAAAGLGPGDLVAASFSGSFPGLNLAVMAACRALDVRLLAVSSVTASTWGANQPGFTWPEMEARLVSRGIVPRASIAVTAGGDLDQALDLDAEGRALAASIRDTSARDLAAAALRPRSFDDAVRQRLGAYRKAADGRRLALYVNVGGAEASLGRSATVLRRRSGFLPAVPFGRPSEQGVLARLAGEGVPALMLLNVRDLALRWDVPLERPPAP